MSKLKPDTRLWTLVGGDLLVILSFVWIGRSSHHLSITNIAAGLSTALPFMIGWFGVMPWFGLYKTAVSQNWRKLLPRLLLGWAVAGPVALILRALFLGRPIPEGIILTFALVSLTYIGLVALLWRLGYSWWVNHNMSHNVDARGS